MSCGYYELKYVPPEIECELLGPKKIAQLQARVLLK